MEEFGTLLYKKRFGGLVKFLSKKFDCDYDNDSGCQNACTECIICKYTNFLEYAHSVAPMGSTIEYDRILDRYIKLTTNDN